MSDPEERDLPCGCFGDWTAVAPACDDFQDDDQGFCLTCGHYEACHDNP